MSTSKDKPKPRRRASAPEREDIAGLLARVFSHPDLPQVIWEHMADALCEMDDSFDKYESPEVMREVIAGERTVSQPRRKGGE